jgi:hypothetical protein
MADKSVTRLRNYQFVVYTPQEHRRVRTGDMCWEITGHIYPYRTREFDYRWLDAFAPPPQKKRR